MRRWVRLGIIGFFALALAIQLVPYGRDHTNPPITAEPAWDSATTRELAVRACFDCHSNETAWPWYTNVAPISWLAQRDVEEGRDKLNFSEWDSGQEAEDAAETVLEAEMPPRSYTLLHPDARLSDQEITALATGLSMTFGSEQGAGRED